MQCLVFVNEMLDVSQLQNNSPRDIFWVCGNPCTLLSSHRHFSFTPEIAEQDYKHHRLLIGGINVSVEVGEQLSVDNPWPDTSCGVCKLDADWLYSWLAGYSGRLHKHKATLLTRKTLGECRPPPRQFSPPSCDLLLKYKKTPKLNNKFYIYTPRWRHYTTNYS